MRLLYLLPGLVPPQKDPTVDRMYHVAGTVSGDVLLPTWAKSPEELSRLLGENSYPTYQVNRFTYHLCLVGKYQYGAVRQKGLIFWFYLREGWRLRKKHKYDCVMCYNWGLAGIAGLILSRLLSAKFVVELANIPEDMYRFNQFGESYHFSAKASLKTRIMRRVIDILLHILVLSADRVKLLYPTQLSHYPRLKNVLVTVAHAYAPVSRVPYTGTEDGSILLVGAPWYVKGVDVLIKAFRKIEADYPEIRLRLLGAYPEEEMLNEMIGDSSQIEILKARPNAEVLPIIANCSIFVLASRTEGASRAILEAMSAGKPIVASRVGGIPYYVEDGVNGLIFESENSDELADKLRLLLDHPELRARFGRKGYDLARTRYDDKTFGRILEEMIYLTVTGREMTTNDRTDVAAARQV